MKKIIKDSLKRLVLYSVILCVLFDLITNDTMIQLVTSSFTLSLMVVIIQGIIESIENYAKKRWYND